MGSARVDDDGHIEIILEGAKEKHPEATRIISDNVPQFIARDFKEVGSEREFVELPNWRGLGMAAAPATETEASAWSVAR